jgi:predicted ArsR family transcriptional regulator
MTMARNSSMGSTRLSILAMLQLQGSLTVDRLAQEVGLSSSTVRRHLDILQRDHLVSFDQARRKPGRPEYVYSLTEDGYESGHRDYKKLLAHLLNGIMDLSPADLADKDGRKLVRLLIARIADEVSWPYVQPGQVSEKARLAKVVQALTDGGFSPELKSEGGQVQIRLCNCPFRSVALSQDSVCLLDHDLIANILGVEPVRESTIHDGHTSCVYVVAADN